MSKRLKIAKFLLFVSLTSKAYGAYYDTLPKGVRTVVFRHVQTSDINSKLNESNKNQDFNWSVNLDAQTLLEVDAVAWAIEELEDISPAAAAAITAGEYRGEATAQVEVDALGIAWGLTDRLTVYAYAPWYRANVDVDITKVQGNNVGFSTGLIDPNNNSVNAAIFKNISPELAAKLNENTYQSIFVNSLGYQPIGNWEGQGLGDTETGLLYRLTDKPNWGLAMTTGIMIPTGRVDQPDIVQDFGFGDGQYDVFAEFGGGFDILPWWTVDAWTRYTYQLPMTQTLRIPESEEFPFSSESETFWIKLGDRIKSSISTTFEVTDYFSIRPEYILESIALSDFKSDNPEADRIYEVRSNSFTQEAKLTLNFTTINLFQSGKFVAPLDLSISGQTLVDGTNTPDFSRFDIDFRVYF